MSGTRSVQLYPGDLVTVDRLEGTVRMADAPTFLWTMQERRDHTVGWMGKDDLGVVVATAYPWVCVVYRLKWGWAAMSDLERVSAGDS